MTQKLSLYLVFFLFCSCSEESSCDKFLLSSSKESVVEITPELITNLVSDLNVFKQKISDAELDVDYKFLYKKYSKVSYPIGDQSVSFNMYAQNICNSYFFYQSDPTEENSLALNEAVATMQSFLKNQLNEYNRRQSEKEDKIRQLEEEISSLDSDSTDKVRRRQLKYLSSELEILRSRTPTTQNDFEKLEVIEEKVQEIKRN